MPEVEPMAVINGEAAKESFLAEEAFRLSAQQSRVLSQQLGASGEQQIAVTVASCLPHEDVRRALLDVIDAVEILRTLLKPAPGLVEPVQRIATHLEPIYRHEDLRDLSLEQRNQRLAELLENPAAAAMHQRVLDPVRGPVLRAVHFHMGPDEDLLLLALPASHTDQRGLEVLLKMWGQAFTALGEGKTLEAEVLQYADVTEWQHELLADPQGDDGRRYWQEILSRDPAPWSIEDTEPKTQKPIGQEFLPIYRLLSRDLVRNLQEIAASAGADLESLLLTCWGLLWRRLGGKAQLTLGLVSDGRSYEELIEVPGLLARTLPLPLDISLGLDLNSAIARIHQDREQAQAWQEYLSFEQPAQRALRFDVGFAFRSAAEISFGGLAGQVYARRGCLERQRFALAAEVSEKGLQLELWHDGSIDSIRAERVLSALFALLEDAAKRPKARLQDLSLVGPAEVRQLVSRLENPTREAADFVHRRFERQANVTPEAVAVMDEEGSLSYGQLEVRANRLAHFLRRRGVGPEVPVGLYLERSTRAVIAILGVLKAGGVWVPLECDGPLLRLGRQAEDAGLRWIITDEAGRHRLEGGLELPMICLDRDHDEVEAEQPEAPEFPEPDSKQLAYVIFTSGSTGHPKGVAVSHGALASYERALRTYALGKAPSFALVSTLAADLGITAIFGALCGGGTLHVALPETVTDADRFAAFLERREVDILKIVPSHLSALMAGGGVRVLPRRALIVGGEALTLELVREIRHLAPTCVILNEYGPTETTVGTVTWTVGENDDGVEGVPIGMPLSGTWSRVLDSGGRPVLAGMTGELYVGGDAVARGYLKRPGATAERFVPDPYAEDAGERLYRTGDRVRLDAQDRLWFLGRLDQQVKIRGFRVELGEIESALRELPGVQAAAVIFVQHRLIGCLVPEAGIEAVVPTPAWLQQELTSRLPAVMIPDAAVLLSRLPLTANGKLDRSALARLPAVGEILSGKSAEVEPPRTTTETTLVRIWTEVLRRPVRIHDNFFELGGDSILNLMVAARAKKEGLALSPKQLFDHPTVARLAPLVEGARTLEAEQGRVVGAVPLTPAQHWFLGQGPVAPDHFNMTVLLRLLRPVEPARLKQALGALVDQHDALRLRLVPDSDAPGGWRQSLEPEEPEVDEIVEFHNLADLPADLQAEEIGKLAETVQQSLSLSRGPLVRALSFDLGPRQESRLLVVAHHLAVDVVSWQVLLGDLDLAFRQLEERQAIQLPPKTTSFKVWAERLQAFAATLISSKEGRDEANAWLSAAQAVTRPIPRDLPGKNLQGSARSLSTALEDFETQQMLRQLTSGVEVQEALLTALVLAFERWTGGRRLRVDLESHGREDLFDDVDVSRTVGWFTAHFPVLLDLRRTTGPAAALAEVRDVTRKLPRHGLGFGLLRYLAPASELTEELRQLPLSEVSFNYLGQLDAILPATGRFAPAVEVKGNERSPHNQRPHLLDVNAGLLGGRLEVRWTYSQEVHRRSTIERLSESFLEQLRRIISSYGTSDASSLGGTSDVELRSDEMESILSQLSGDGKESARG